MAGENEQDDVVVEDPTSLDAVSEPHPASGMFQYMQEFMGDEDADDKGEGGADDADSKAGEDDDSFSIERLDEAQSTQFNEVLSKDMITDGDLALFNFSDEELSQVKEKFPQKFAVREDPPVKLENMESPALIEEVKKNQRIVSEKDTTIKALETQLSERPTDSVTDEKLKAFIEDLKGDLQGGWKKHSKELGLPDLGLVQASTAEGSVEDRLLQYQETELRGKIEEEFGLEKGEFEVVREDLYQPKTASYRWRTMTEAREKEIQGEVNRTMQSESNRILEVQKQQSADIKWYADNFLDGKEEDAKAVVESLNAIPEKIAKGEMTADKHPFALRNLMVGLNHEALLNDAVATAVTAVTKQFNDKGIYLKSSDELPTDITKVKAPKGGGDKIEFDKKKIGNSPMLRNVNDLLNS